MPGINPEEEAARLAYYQSRRKVGSYLNRDLSFYPGAPTIPQSFTGNLMLVAGGTGPGAKILNGINPFVPEPLPCEEIVIESLVVGVFDDLNITVTYNVLPGDVYVMFNTSDGTTLPIISVTQVLEDTIVVFDDDSPPATPGSYSFKIIREDNLDCFAVRSNVFQIAPMVCLLTITDMTGDLFAFPGTPGHTVTLTGTGFLSGGPLIVAFENTFPPFNPMDITLVTIIDDTSLTIDFDATDGGPAPDGLYGVRIILADDPSCEADIGITDIFQPQVAVFAV